MQIRLTTRILGLLALALLAGCATPPSQPVEDLHLRVITTHDFHGALLPRAYPWTEGRDVGGAATLKAYMDRAQQDCDCTTVRLDGGDVMQGTLQSNLTLGESSVAAYNILGIDAAAIGNHELDWEVDVLRERLQEAEFAWLGANVFRRDTGQRPDWARPWAIIERDGINIGVVGYMTLDTPATLRVATTAPYQFRANYAAIADAIQAVQRAGADFVVIVAHAGGECRDTECGGEMVDLARSLPEGAVQLIVGGHNHRPGQGVVNGVPIIRAGSSGTAIGIVDLHRRADGSHAFDIATEDTYADAITPDATVTAVLAPWLAEAERIASTPVATLAEPLSNSRSGDRKLGNMIIDAIRLSAGTDIAMTNPSLRAPLAAGPVSYGDLYEVLPFGNEIMKLRLTGKQLREVVERAGHYYYFSNLSIRWDNGAAEGARVRELEFEDGRPFSDEATYTLATSDFLAAGGDGLDMLIAIEREPMGVIFVDAVASYLKALAQPVRLGAE